MRKFDPDNLTLKGYNYDEWYKEKSSDEENLHDLPPTPPIDGDEEVSKRESLKMLTPNKLLTRLPVLLALIKAGNNSYTLKNKIREIL